MLVDRRQSDVYRALGLADPLAPGGTRSGAQGGEAVGRRTGHGASPALELEPNRSPVRMRRLGSRIAEDVVGEAQQSAQSFG
jgi:hypothetical protein